MDGRTIPKAKSSDVVDLGDGRLGINVVAKRPRLVPIRPPYDDLVREAVELSKGPLLVGSMTRLRSHQEKFIVSGTNEFIKLSRLRASWLVELLESGERLDQIVYQAGFTSCGPLDGFMRQLPDPPWAAHEPKTGGSHTW